MQFLFDFIPSPIRMYISSGGGGGYRTEANLQFLSSLFSESEISLRLQTLPTKLRSRTYSIDGHRIIDPSNSCNCKLAENILGIILTIELARNKFMAVTMDVNIIRYNRNDQ